LSSFFLTPGENGGNLWYELEDKRSQLFSGCNPGNATSIVPAALSILSQTLSSRELPEWAHPRQLLRYQILEEIFQVVALAPSSQMTSVELGVLDEFEVSEHRFLLDSRYESSLPRSCDLDQTKHLPIPDADPPKSAIRQQFSIQSMPPGFALPGLIAFLGLLQIGLYLKLSWSKYNTYIVNVHVFSALVLVAAFTIILVFE
jgi:hypothetical protein